MQPGAGRPRLETGHALGNQPSDQPGQNVARAGGCEERRAGCVDDRAPVSAATTVDGPFSSTTQRA